MAPLDQLKYTSSTKKPSPRPAVDDDDKWTDLVSEKEGKDSPAQTEPSTLPAVDLKFPPPMAPTPVYSLPDSLGRSTPTQQMTLEAQLMHLAEVDLGLMNAVDILEKKILNLRDRNISNEPYELNFPLTFPNINPTRITTSPANRASVYSTERHNSAAALRDMAYLLGLGRSVKILKQAVADENRKDATFNIRVSPGPVPMPPPPPFPQPPLYIPPVNPLSHLMQEKDFRNIAKDIVKESVREYKDTVVGPSIEEVQQEMIKLCRDVCRDALNRKD
jgi:hypothetical protein